MEQSKEMGRFKVDEDGKFVDMKQLSNGELKKLLAFYERKLERARSRDMRIAYEQCVKQINNFMIDNLLEDRMDIFSVAHQDAINKRA